jgi:hypothetical protein
MDARGLSALEARFAPNIIRGRGVFSPLDPNPHAPWNLGGDKMGADRNGYAENYASALAGLSPLVVVELGVFTGASLALWDALFPDSLIVGLDLDFERFNEHLPVLLGAGAFPVRRPRLVTFDAYGSVTPLVDALGGLTIDLFVDDGPHTEDAITRMAKQVGPLMSRDSLYVIEDFTGGGRILREHFPGAAVSGGGRWWAGRLSRSGGHE